MNKQITEDYCSFEIAKLLKEKGFDIKCNTYFISDNEIAVIPTLRDFNNNGIYLSAPTQSLALKWLREVHKIAFCISPMQEIDGDCIEWCAEIYKIVGEKGLSLEDEIYRDSYEEAQNEALKYTLEKLI